MASETNITERIRGKVARILNSRELALNVGECDGVQLGMYFDVLREEDQNIEDPDTGEVLGSIERPKVRVKIISVQDNLSVATTYKKKRVNLGGTYPNLVTSLGLSRALMPPRWVTKYETLKTEEKTWENLDEEDSYVKTGDPVLQVLSDFEEEQIQDGEPVTRVAETA